MVQGGKFKQKDKKNFEMKQKTGITATIRTPNPGRLVRDMHEAYRKVRPDADSYGCFMPGPSVTAA